MPTGAVFPTAETWGQLVSTEGQVVEHKAVRPGRGMFLGPDEEAFVARVPHGEQDVMLGRRTCHRGTSPA